MWKPNLDFIKGHPVWTAVAAVVSFLLIVEGLWSLGSDKPFLVWLNAQFVPIWDWLWITLYKWVAIPFGVLGFVILVFILWSLVKEKGKGSQQDGLYRSIKLSNIQIDIKEDEIADLKQKLETAKAKLNTQIKRTEEVEDKMALAEQDEDEVRAELSECKKAYGKYEMDAILHTLNLKKETLELTVTVVYMEYREKGLAERIAGVFQHVGWVAETKKFAGENPPHTECPVLVQSVDPQLSLDVLAAIRKGGLLGALNSNVSADHSLKAIEVVITLFPKPTS